MRVGILTDRPDFFYDIHSLVKSFFPDDDVSIFQEDETAKREAGYNLELKVGIPDYTDRKAAKDAGYAYVTGIDKDCRLLVRYEDGREEAIGSGEVSVVKY